MPFPFSFSINVPELSNPFSAQLSTASQSKHGQAVADKSSRSVQSVTRNRRHHSRSSSLSPAPTMCRKRGWVPSSPEPSEATAMTTSTSGFLDTPAKYRDTAALQDEDDEIKIAELPPAKRRRGLTGSIISTALSAALIGTAVGLTVYRLWRDRGKDTEQLPPPPYQEQWGDARITEIPEEKATPTVPRNRKTRPASTVARRTVGRHRKTPSRSLGITRGRDGSPAFSQVPPHFDFQNAPEHDVYADGEVDDQMDWIGDKLAKLIEEGKRALGKEVVVMSEAQEDEVDDGDSAWQEEQDPSLPGPSSYHRSRPLGLSTPRLSAPSVPTYVPNTSSARTKRFWSADGTPSSLNSIGGWPTSIPNSPPLYSRGHSVESDAKSHLDTVGKDDEAWQSPEIRESMERARTALLQRRTGPGAAFPG